MSDDMLRTYTSDRVAAAQSAMRSAAGLPPEEFPEEQIVHMLGDEIKQLRERGFDDARIAEVMKSAGLPIAADVLTNNYMDTSDIQR